MGDGSYSHVQLLQRREGAMTSLRSNGIYSTRHCIYRTSSKHVTPWYSPLWLMLAKSSTPVSFLWDLLKLKLWFIWEQYYTGNTFLMTQVLSLIMKTFCDQTVFYNYKFLQLQSDSFGKSLFPKAPRVHCQTLSQTTDSQRHKHKMIKLSDQAITFRALKGPHALSFLGGCGHTFDCQQQ